LLRRAGVIDRAAQRLEALVDRLVDESCLSVGKVTLELEEVDLRAVVVEAAARLAEEASTAGSSISIRPGLGVMGRWDRLRVDQAVTNLLTNAIKYGGRGVVEVEVGSEGDMATLSIRDYGMGIPVEAQARIFERFERAAPLRHFGGFGLGLWIVRLLVEAHGGRVHLWSRPGEGSVFSLELPVRPAEAASAVPSVNGGEAHP
jgi:signal transduction histidine kinase